MRILLHTVFTCMYSIYMAAYGKTYKMDLFPRPYLKLKSAGVCEDITQQCLFFLLVHKFNYLFFY